MTGGHAGPMHRAGKTAMTDAGACVRICLLLCLFASAFSARAAAEESPSFQGKTISVVVGYAAGGGTDAMARLTAAFLSRLMPGNPTVVVRNIPGAESITAMNYLVQQVVPDGLTVVTASNTAADPINYRKPQARYDPTSFEVVGGVGRGGSALVINSAAAARLSDRQAAPVIMGTLSGVQRSGMLMTAWGIGFLGWNARWVAGYRGTNELTLALERGEIDMTSTANLFLLQKLLATDKFKLLAQTGRIKDGVAVARPDFHDAPLLSHLLQGHVDDPLAAQAFRYWDASVSMDKWLALPPKSPPAMLAAYREAFARMIQDPEFIERGRAISDDFEPMSHGEVEGLIETLHRVPPAAVDYIGTLLRRQGLEAQ
jgi:tripartite-type tricarboxylate transporter receptor subunit TctC